MFDERERHVLESLARRYQQAMRLPKSARFGAINELQDHLLTLARVHTDRLILGSFVAGIEACEDQAAKRMLNTLCDLYVIDNLEADRAWFTDHSFMTQARSKSLTRTLNHLCGELRPDALALWWVVVLLAGFFLWSVILVVALWPRPKASQAAG